MTDPEIADDRLPRGDRPRGQPRPSARRRSPATSSHLPDAVAESDGYRVMPGIEELLDRADRATASCSASSPATSRRPPTSSSPAPTSTASSAFGGYGSDSRDRTEVTKTALERGALVSGGTARPTAPASPSATPRATSRPATAPASRSSASPPAATRVDAAARSRRRLGARDRRVRLPGLTSPSGQVRRRVLRRTS